MLSGRINEGMVNELDDKQMVEPFEIREDIGLLNIQQLRG
jgi:hypothetical protein